MSNSIHHITVHCHIYLHAQYLRRYFSNGGRSSLQGIGFFSPRFFFFGLRRLPCLGSPSMLAVFKVSSMSWATCAVGCSLTSGGTDHVAQPRSSISSSSSSSSTINISCSSSSSSSSRPCFTELHSYADCYLLQGLPKRWPVARPEGVLMTSYLFVFVDLDIHLD